MTKETVTEALASIKTLDKRIATQTAFVTEHLTRPEALRDPLERQGGAVKLIGEARQSIADLWTERVRIRRAIADSNVANSITVEGQTRSMAEWLIWKREVAPQQQLFLRAMFLNISRERSRAQSKGGSVVAAGAESKPTDTVVNLDERALTADLERLETIMGKLDGLLSLKNATIEITY